MDNCTCDFDKDSCQYKSITGHRSDCRIESDYLKWQKIKEAVGLIPATRIPSCEDEDEEYLVYLGETEVCG